MGHNGPVLKLWIVLGSVSGACPSGFSCFGSRFSVLEQKVTLVKLLQHFDFERPADVQKTPGYNTEPCSASD